MGVVRRATVVSVVVKTVVNSAPFRFRIAAPAWSCLASKTCPASRELTGFDSPIKPLTQQPVISSTSDNDPAEVPGRSGSYCCGSLSGVRSFSSARAWALRQS